MTPNNLYRVSVATFHGIEKKLLLSLLGNFKEFNARFPGFNLRALKHEFISGLEGYRSYDAVSPQLEEAINLLIENWVTNSGLTEKVDFIAFGEVCGERQSWRLAWIIQTEGNGIVDEFVNGFRVSNFSSDKLSDHLVLKYTPDEYRDNF
jgi:hypothetical protein